MSKLRSDTALALELGDAIRGGNILSLKKLLAENSGLARVCIVDAPVPGRSVEGRSLLHVLTDWPGNFPRGAATVALLVEAGADVNARFIGNHEETPLHWAASCDDVAVLDALLDHGADIEARGAVIGGGTPLADAVAFAQWNAARRLIERGAEATLWQAAALGLMERVAGHYHQRLLVRLPRRTTRHRRVSLGKGRRSELERLRQPYTPGRGPPRRRD